MWKKSHLSLQKSSTEMGTSLLSFSGFDENLNGKTMKARSRLWSCFGYSLRTSVRAALVIGLFAALLSGCSSRKYVVFVNYPGFWTEPDEYNQITVAPVINDQYPDQYIVSATNKLLSDLENNNHYVIYNYTGGIDADNLSEQEADLVAYTTINSYSVNRGMDRRSRKEKRTRINDETGEEYTIEVDVPYDYHWQNSYANVSLTLYSSRVGNGVLTTYNRDGSCSDSDDTPPHHHPNLYSHENMERCAIEDAIGNLVYQITPTFSSALLEPDETLMVYQTIDGDWKKVSKVKEKYGEDFRVELALPGIANMNDFVLEVVADNDEKTVVESWMVHWNSNYSSFYYNVNMYDMYIKTGGCTKFLIRLRNKVTNSLELENDFKLSFKDDDAAKARLAEAKAAASEQ